MADIVFSEVVHREFTQNTSINSRSFDSFDARAKIAGPTHTAMIEKPTFDETASVLCENSGDQLDACPLRRVESIDGEAVLAR
ncbi:MAG: hypothetical protein CMJ64_16485 [Planctomycetaceae bacterium]|nr:hypothetical protein [Planctomycetaceae bacterium]